ncbi:MAG TPA: radical SAM protein [Symbiobacteriaceae bacterium]|jgi:uncharacterized Fe-S cluster-containing radical SAM superfamily protein
MMETCTLPRQVVLRKLEELWLHVNFRCNLSCAHCLFSCNPRYDGGIPDLTLQQAQSYTEVARTAGVTKLYLTGGEPLLWKPLEAYLDWYFGRPDPQRLVILTNGTLIWERRAELFAHYHPQGLEIRISLECYTPEENDRWRGAGVHARVMSSIKKLNRGGVRPYIAFSNKSGGLVTAEAAAKLEADFRSYLWEHHGVEIAGLKMLGAFGLAASGLGLVPCPIVTDLADAVLEGSMADQLGQPVDLKFKYCRDCFKTGGT